MPSLDSPASGGSAGAGSGAVHSPSLSAVQHSGPGSGCAPHSPRPLWLALQSRVHSLPVFSPEQTETQDQSVAQITEAQLAEADQAASHADGRLLAADSELTAAPSAGDGQQKARRDGSVCVLPAERDDQPDQSAILIDSHRALSRPLDSHCAHHLVVLGRRRVRETH